MLKQAELWVCLWKILHHSFVNDVLSECVSGRVDAFTTSGEDG